MAAAKTVAQRQKEFKAAKKAKGMTEVHNIWAHKDDHEEVKAYAEMVSNRRASLESESISFNHKLWEPVKKWLIVGGEPPEWAKRDNGVYLAFDRMKITISKAVMTQECYYKGDLFFTRKTHLTGFDYQEYGFETPRWMGLLFNV